MKTKEELSSIKEEVEKLSKKLSELTEDELTQVVGGAVDHNVFLTEQRNMEGKGMAGFPAVVKFAEILRAYLQSEKSHPGGTL